MPKRKREDDIDEGGPIIEDQALRIKVSRLKAKLDQGLKSLTSALKLARGFERQKLGRRQKQANEEPHTLLRLREEVIVLKQLQLDQTAKTHLLKQLSRTKRIKESPAFIQVYGTDPTVEPIKAGAEANVLGRLFNSAPVKQALSEVMKNIFGVLGIPQDPASTTGRISVDKAQANGTKVIEVAEDDFNGFSSSASIDELHMTQDQISNNGDENRAMDEIVRYRLAASDEEIVGEDFSYGHSHHRDDLSVSSDDFDEAGIDASESRKSTKAPNVKPTSRTAFLPSLSMGGYYSGSESDEPDLADHRGPPMPQLRNNRRGQRARQQLAEKKFGKNARHLQKQKASGSRNAGWDSQRGAVESRGHKTHDQYRRGRSNRETPNPQQARNSHLDQNKPKKRDDQGSLHPSWEAAKKKKMQDQGLVKFAGQKITFD